jgi:phosphate:Na+ symporter
MEDLSTMDIVFIVFAFLGGFGMFIYGMNIMATGLQKATGDKMKYLLGKLTNNRLVAVLTGAAVTAIIQSSSATTVMVVGFVNASLLTLTQAVGVIMGANIGTTITAWIVSSSEWFDFFSPTKIAPLCIGVGAVLLFFSKTKKKKQVGEIIIGFGLLFIGIEYMKDAMTPFKDSPAFVSAFQKFGSNPFLGILVGFGVTAIIQSSSASVSILQAVAALGAVPWNAAVYIILGQNIGTCVTAMLSSIGASKMAKRAAIIHLLFNVIGTVVFAIGAVVLFTYINPSLGQGIISLTSISIFHTVFNISNTALLFFFAPVLVSISGRIIKGSDKDTEARSGIALQHLDNRILETPAFAVESAVKEVVRMGELILKNTQVSLQVLLEANEGLREEVMERAKNAEALDEMITDYLIKVSNLSLSEHQQLTTTNLFHMVNDIENIGDSVEHIIGLTKRFNNAGGEMSKSAKADLYNLENLASETVALALKIRADGDISLIGELEEKHKTIDKLEHSLRNKHIKRLSKNKCKPGVGIIFLDIISNLERISNHSLNIVTYMKDEWE